MKRTWLARSAVAAVLVSCTGCLGPETDSLDDPTTHRADAVTECGVPAKYDYEAYLDEHSDASKGGYFWFSPAPELGVYVHEIFIPNKKVNVGVPGVYALGDGRMHDDRFDPKRTRGFAVIDFRRGLAWVIVNPSHVQVCVGFCKTQGFDARAVHAEWSGGHNWVWGDWIDDDTFRLRVSLTNSAPSQGWLGTSADHQILIDRKTGSVRYEGDGFPSTGTYRMRPDAIDGSSCAPSVMQRTWAHGIDALGDNPAFTHDWATSPWR